MSKVYSFHRQLIAQSLPIVIQSLMLALVAAADALMLGKLNQNSMAAVSLATQIQFIENMIFWTIASGIGILGAQYWGKKDIPVLESIFGISVRESIYVSIPFFIGCQFFPEKLMPIFTSDETLISLGAQYLRAASWSYLLTGVSICYQAVMRVSDHIPQTAWISSGAVVLNIIFNAVFIFGLGEIIPAMGIAGAAFATILARVIELCWCVVASYRKNFLRLKVREIFRMNWKLIAEFWHYTAPILGSAMLWGVGFTSYTAFMGHLGADSAAANAIAAVARDLLCCLCNGISTGASIMVGNELGAGKLMRGKIYGKRIFILGFGTGLFCSIVLLAMIPLVLRYVNLTEQAQKYMIGMFVIMAVYMIGRCVCNIGINGIFSAGGDTLFDTYSLAVCMWGVALPCAFLGTFYFHFPVLVIYACTCLDEVGKVPWVIYHFRKYKWVKNITRDEMA